MAEQPNVLNTKAKVQYAYDYVNKYMICDKAFTNSMIVDTLRNIDHAYYRLLRSERRRIINR